MPSIPFLEKDLETILYETPQEAIQKRGLQEFYYQRIARQFHLGAYGIADLVTFIIQSYGNRNEPNAWHRNIDVTVYELKQDKIDVNTLLQGVGYMKGIVELGKEFETENTSISVDLVLIGRSIDTKNSFSFLPDFFQGVTMYTYDYRFDGICFQKVENYRRSDNSFSHQTLNRTKKIGVELIKQTDKQSADDLPF